MKRFRPETPAMRPVVLFALCCFFLATGAGLALARQSSQEEPKQAEEMKAEPAKLTPEQMTAATTHPTGPHHPPKSGKVVGDHWTPYMPPDPESFPKGSEVHTIQPGDTLWDLAAKFLNNAYLWPQIWDVNQYILDSHWIYPGDALLLPGAPTVIAEAPRPAPAPAPPAVVEEETPEAAPPAAPTAMPPPPALVPVAVDHDLYCSNYIASPFEAPALFIEEKEEGGKSILGTGDVVFLNLGEKDGIKAGRIYTVIAPQHEVYHPERREELLGTSVKMIGRVRVLAVQSSSATAEIADSCDAIKVGDYLVPFEEIPVPLSSPVAFRADETELKGENTGFIVHVMDDKLSFGAGDIVNLDMGSSNGIQPGDIFTIYREWGGRIRFASAESYIEGQQGRAEKLRKEGEQPKYSLSILGQLVVLTAREKTSTAKVLVSVREMAVGDKVELR